MVPTRCRPSATIACRKGCFVGQNGLRGNNYAKDGPRASPFLAWGQADEALFRNARCDDAGTTGPLMDVMKRAEDIGCDYLGVYSADVLKGTQGQPGYDAEYEKLHCKYGARALGGARAADCQRQAVACARANART